MDQSIFLTKEDVGHITRLNKGVIFFEDYVDYVTGYKVFPIFSELKKDLEKICNEIKKFPIVDEKRKRINETSPAVEKLFEKITTELDGVECKNKEMKARGGGYPDGLVLFNYCDSFVFCEIKTTESIKSLAETTFRSFYMSGELPRIINDGIHVTLIFEVSYDGKKIIEDNQIDLFGGKKKHVCMINGFEIEDCHNKLLSLKGEFQCNGKELMKSYNNRNLMGIGGIF